jgi:hypothetical protein
MIEQQARNNAMICYFFLGPIFLLARKNTPLSHPYVRLHAKKSSLILWAWIIGYILYLLIAPLIDWINIWIHLQTVLATWWLLVLFYFLLRGGYWAYQWNSEYGQFEESILKMEMTGEDIQSHTEEDRMRYFWSFLPLLGIYLAEKYPSKYTQIGKNNGTLSYVLIVCLIIYTGDTSLLSLIWILLYSILLAYIGVAILILHRFPGLSVLSSLPSSTSIESHIYTLFMSLIQFFWVIFWGSKKETYTELYAKIHTYRTQAVPYEQPYFMPRYMIAIPVVNIISLPSLFIKKYRENRANIVQWLLLSCITLWFWLQYGIGSNAIWLIFVPIVELGVYSMNNSNARAFLIDIIAELYRWSSNRKHEIKELAQHNESVHFEYPQNTQNPPQI